MAKNEDGNPLRTGIFGIALVAGRKRVPRPAAGMTALMRDVVIGSPYRQGVSGHGTADGER